MKKMIPFAKLSKKKQRELSAKRRGSWGGLNPVTRKPENSKAYHRKKARNWRENSPMTVPFYFSGQAGGAHPKRARLRIRPDLLPRKTPVWLPMGIHSLC